MKKCVFIFVLCILFAEILFPQADLTINLFLHPPDNSWGQTLLFGVDSTATDGIDPWLGEDNLPPDFCAPWGVFCAYFLIPPFDGMINSWLDFRFGELPYTGQVTHKIDAVNYETTGNDSIYIRYDLPEGVSIHFYDELGGMIINFTVVDSGEVAYLYIPTLSELWMDVYYENVIPVNIVSFTGSIKNRNNVELKWLTATETNNNGFEIQRKMSGRQLTTGNWKKVGFVAGYGTTTEQKPYSFYDKDVTTGIYKYRLKQVDFDGTFQYSNEIEIAVDFAPDEFALFQNYPNPFNPSTTIKYEIPEAETIPKVFSTTLKIYDILGNEIATLVNESKQSGVYEVEFDASKFSSGVYFYQLSVSTPRGGAGSFNKTVKMILAK